MSSTASPCLSPTIGPSGSSSHTRELAKHNINSNPHTRPVPFKSPILPSELRSPLSSSFPSASSTSTMSAATASIISESLKTPITPPLAYTTFLQSAVTHASASNTPTVSTFNITEVVKSPRYLPGLPSEGAKVPLSPMYAEFLKQHFANSMLQPSTRRFRASVSGPSMREKGALAGSGISSCLNPGSGPGRMDPPRSPGLVMLGNAGIINGSLRNKEAILRAKAAAAASASGSAGVAAEKLKAASTSLLTPSSASASTKGVAATPSSSKSLEVISKAEESLQSPKSTAPEPEENAKDMPVKREDRKRSSEEEAGRESEEGDDIKESTVVVPEGKVGAAMNLMPAPKGKRRKIE